ncbi:hypothetical protein C2S53_016734 [Perilla frutescens var. hirtella]|uniref:Uncharacterized protein n=1 Tax=Perilla frutescens var. hirtella TaxID=608512 RepID=A0AAD4P1V1_PERFH|nr:hypothetical protein C2S53_016734 [Perilla frutescens var. hirtella]
MSCIFWTCRGLGNPASVRMLKSILKQKPPMLVFLMKTKLIEREWQHLFLSLKFDECICIPCELDNGDGFVLVILMKFYITRRRWGIFRDQRKLNAFRNALGDCHLEDLGYEEFKYTWTNNQSGNQNI